MHGGEKVGVAGRGMGEAVSRRAGSGRGSVILSTCPEAGGPCDAWWHARPVAPAAARSESPMGIEGATDPAASLREQ